jgi:predicted nuclease with RNAse H fold
MGSATTDAELITLVHTYRPGIVAIDAPLSLPRGLSPTAFMAGRPVPLGPTGRACERALKDLGIGCFYTTPRSIIKEMVLRAIALAEALQAEGLRVAEVYPFATRVLLFGRMPIRKTTVQGRRVLQRHLATLIGGLPAPPLSHDELDALLAAYTGLLILRGEAQGWGDPEEGIIWLPTPPKDLGR